MINSLKNIGYSLSVSIAVNTIIKRFILAQYKIFTTMFTLKLKYLENKVLLIKLNYKNNL